ncbi:MAG: DUF6786 family protein [Planctomycetota bacterium]
MILRQPTQVAVLLILSLGVTAMSLKAETPGPTFGADVAVLKQHTDAIVLRDGDAAVVVVPEYQGRVMTATARGDQGLSSGWINYDLVKQGVVSPEQAKGSLDEHMYAFGGEERFWMGPEGGQYSIFFEPKTPFDFASWHTPDPIDNEAWKAMAKTDRSVTLEHRFGLKNHSGTEFSVSVQRKVSLLDSAQISELLSVTLPDSIDAVAYQSENSVTNEGKAAWTKDSGLLSIWMLCMFQPSPTTTVFVPYNQGDEQTLGKVVSDDYFGKVSSDRLKVKDGVIYFKADGKERGKIGLSPERSTGIAGSYDPAAEKLTLLIYDQPAQHSGYVNSKWELQDQPYQGDAINSYNDGPVDESGEQMGPFYELESSSPALALEPGDTATHSQTVLHLYGAPDKLQAVIENKLKVDLTQVESVFH